MIRYCLLLIVIITSCSNPQGSISTLFKQIDANRSGIDFINKVSNSSELNIFNYRNFYNGGGVAIIDVNNDGLEDIYFTANQGSNKLYLNLGDLRFKDITKEANVELKDYWSTGVSIVDINQDGLLDMYISNAGFDNQKSAENILFINKGDNIFEDQTAKYGLGDEGYTTHANFFDYDQDGDLDVYIVNNSFIPVSSLNYANNRDMEAEKWDVKDFLKGGGDKLLRNDSGFFTDVTKQANIYSSLIGFGLGATIADLNQDQLPDIYVSNDFYEKDYLYINQGNGTFNEELELRLGHCSMSSMGADIADINNDGQPEIFVTEMLPFNDERLKKTTTFESINLKKLKEERGFYHQFMQNTLQLNNGDGTFKDIAHYSGVAATDWSWGALFADADLDGYKDLFVCNGIQHDLVDQDFIDFFANDMIQKMVLKGKKEHLDSIINKMPSTPIENKVFRNIDGFQFTDVSKMWGLNIPSFSNGAAYADLDNDGDIEFIVNNVNDEAFLFENKANELNSNRSISLSLRFIVPNINAVGSEVKLYTNKGKQTVLNYPQKGFQSSVSQQIIFGISDSMKIDSIEVVWPNKQIQFIDQSSLTFGKNIIEYKASSISKEKIGNKNNKTVFSEVYGDLEKHQEDDYLDFNVELGIPFLLSREGPCSAVANLGGKNSPHLIVGGAKGQQTQIYKKDEIWEMSKEISIDYSVLYEDTAIDLMDLDNDGDLDLFIGSGGNVNVPSHPIMQDRIYLNEKGKYYLSKDALPKNGMNTSAVIAQDFDHDNDMDLFVTSRSAPLVYGLSPKHYLYINQSDGTFKLHNDKLLDNIGMITDAKLLSDSQIVVTIDWGAPKIITIDKKLKISVDNLIDEHGWWSHVNIGDVDMDGDQDIVLGNRGENFYTYSSDERLDLWVNDFDDNGTIDKIISKRIDENDKPIYNLRDLSNQINKVKKETSLSHDLYSKSHIKDLFKKDKLEQSIHRYASFFQSVLLINDKGSYRIKALPRDVQYSNVTASLMIDYDKDGDLDLLLGGNNYGFLPQFSRLDANPTILLENDNLDFSLIPNSESGMNIQGEIKQFLKFEQDVLVFINNQKPKVFKIHSE